MALRVIGLGWPAGGEAKRAEHSMSNPYDGTPKRTSILGATLVFKGELSADEDLVIQGRVEGSINHTATLTIGKEGRLKAEVRASRIIVEGTVEGDLYGTKAVTVQASAAVTGNIFSPTVSLVEGATFNGRIDMDEAKAVATRPVTAEGDNKTTPQGQTAAK